MSNLINLQDFKSCLEIRDNYLYTISVINIERMLIESENSTKAFKDLTDAEKIKGEILLNIGNPDNIDEKTATRIVKSSARIYRNAAMKARVPIKTKKIDGQDSEDNMFMEWVNSNQDYKEARRKMMIFRQLVDGIGIANYLNKFAHLIENGQCEPEQRAAKEKYIAKAIEWSNERNYENLEDYIRDIVGQAFESLTVYDRGELQRQMLLRSFYRLENQKLYYGEQCNCTLVTAIAKVFDNEVRLILEVLYILDYGYDNLYKEIDLYNYRVSKEIGTLYWETRLLDAVDNNFFKDITTWTEHTSSEDAF